MADRDNSETDFHARFLELAQRFSSLADAILPGGATDAPPDTAGADLWSVFLYKSATEKPWVEYKQVMMDAGDALINAVNAGAITEQRARDCVATFELYGRRDNPPLTSADVFSIYVDSVLAGFGSREGMASDHRNSEDRQPPEIMRASPSSPRSPRQAVDAALARIRRIYDQGNNPAVNQDGCRRYAETCRCLEKQLTKKRSPDVPVSETGVKERRQRKLSPIRGWDTLRLISELRPIRQRNPNISLPDAAKELGCTKSALTRRCKKYGELKKWWDSGVKQTSEPPEGLPSHKRSARLMADRIRHNQDDGGDDE